MRQGRFAGLNGGADAAGTALPSRILLLPAAAAILAIGLVMTAALLGAGPPLVVAAAAAGAALIATTLLAIRARLLADPPVPQQGDGARSRSFVELFESHGLAWFWETNADAALTYISPQLAQALERDSADLIGGRFEELLLVEDSGAGAGERPALGFHLGARFPFHDVIVTPKDRSDGGWLLSGEPRFDEVGRFMGFRGFAASLTTDAREAARSNRLARFDSLTGLPNRARMEAMLDEALANAEDRKQSCALILVDLDRFKAVNDTLGHPVGDVLLQQVAERLTAVVGSDGQVGRLGGDEFEAVFPGMGEEGRLAALADRLIGTLSAPYLIHGHAVSIGASVGIAISRPGRTYAAALVKEADLALYAAKRAGRGTFRFFEAEMHAEETQRKILENDLKSAVAKGQLKLVYQPMVSVDSETLVGFEALVRWWHPVRGPLGPADFLAIAEASKQSAGLGEWIIRTACAEAAHWPAHLRLSVNVAPAELSAGTAAVVTGALAAAGLAPDRLELDVPEQVLLSLDDGAMDALLTLKSLGVRLALDDYGSGVTSLTSLKSVKLDRIKLHPTFLRAAAAKTGRTRALAHALMGLATDLGMTVTAEGAETLEDLELIRALGCDEVQGFLFGRPMPSEEARARAADSKPVDAKEAAGIRPPRHSLIRTGNLHLGEDSWPVRLRNISAGGAMVESGRDMALQAPVELDLLDGVRLRGSVRWSHDGRLGIQFEQAFDLSRLGKARRETAELRMLQPDFLKAGTPPKPKMTIKDVRSA